MIDPKLRGIIFTTAAAVLVAGCGADDIASPGSGGNITINNPATPTPPPPSPPPASTLITPAAGCPTIADPQGLKDNGTITGPTGTYRRCSLPARLNSSSTLPKLAGVVYELPGRVDVGTDSGPTASGADTNVTLTIEPGVIVYGGTGVSWLAVNRGNKINAVGTSTQPIIFTSRDNILGLNNDNSSGQWGGIVLMGRAPITDCEAPAATPGTIACERETEGATTSARYGGASPNDNSGRISYVQIRFSGFVLSADKELQSLTTEGIGSATVLDHIQSFNSSDDAAEFFGGRVNLKYFVAVGAEDDNLDTDTGVKANIQYVIAVQRQGVGDAMIEADSDNSVDGDNPRQNTKISNFVFIPRISTGSDQATMLLRGGTDYSLANGIVVSPNYACLRISRAQTASATVNAGIDEAGSPVFRAVQMQCGATKYIGSNGVTAAEVSTIFGSGTNANNDAYIPSLTSLFINGATETAITPFNAKGFDSYFDTTTYIGAVKDASDTWYRNWTCNSATADFGGTGGLCTSLPTT